MTKATVLLLTAFLCAGAANPCGEPGFHVTSKGLMAWTAPNGGWVLAGLKVFVMSVVKEMVAKKPAGVEALKAYERVASERGIWLNFVVKFCGVKRVVFTRSTKIVVVAKAGRRVESEVILFSRDLAQTEVLDASQWPVVVTSESVWCVPGSDQPMGFVRFPAGSFVRDDIVAFEIVGAVEQRGEE